MGIDSVIKVKMRHGEPPPPKLKHATQWRTEGSKRPDVYSCHLAQRFYGDGYRRGPWPEILEHLLILQANLGVERFWYGGDCYFTDDDYAEVTNEWLAKMNAMWVEHGCRQ